MEERTGAVEPNSESTIRLRSISIDRASRTVLVEGTAIALTPTEYSILELLAARRGEVVQRKEIYKKFSDSFDASLLNLLDVHMCNLRRKLGTDIIKTRRGYGYVIVETPE